jgi:hypothetical protein
VQVREPYFQRAYFRVFLRQQNANIFGVVPAQISGHESSVLIKKLGSHEKLGVISAREPGFLMLF